MGLPLCPWLVYDVSMIVIITDQLMLLPVLTLATNYHMSPLHAHDSPRLVYVTSCSHVFS